MVRSGSHGARRRPDKQAAPFCVGRRRVWALVFFAFWLISCSRLPVQPGPAAVSPEAAVLLAGIERRNRELETFKGIGSLHLQREDLPRTVRAAWVARFPDRLRLELLGVAGTPLASVLADDDGLLFHLYDSGETYRRWSGTDGLKSIIGVSLQTAEVVFLLGGRIFLDDFRQASVKDGALLLEGPGGRLRQKIFPAAAGGLRMVERFDESGRRRYRVVAGPYHEVDGFSIPGSIRVTAEGREILRLSVDRFWANPSLTASAFILDLEEKGARQDR
jgi:hypothetical protein